ncbi:fibronectin type III domain-containing protein [Dactylosporangium aurantiacum]|uniref:Fibronectin type III domain-containing protein n=1 Tax=Dactylosporangium aurantiacum TaxID=35754 RepID=A0A9Q9IHT5_9ACTN|nr:fibronectin type III domain-containing protein [Dactylosporangium aurantiacum]MDG6107469.1 fibronectin type III domain-containing protein [Dactylosporangium aurantiacum]UWZ54410.1 fibronectin type III domain-containing protein [Dactylosporangium aurantiacum]
MTAGSLLVAQPASAADLTAYDATVTAAPLSLKVVFTNTTPSGTAAADVGSFVAYADGPDADSDADSSCTVSVTGGNADPGATCYIPNLVAGTAYTVTTKARNLSNTADLALAVANVVGSPGTPAALTAPGTVNATPTGVSGEVEVSWIPGNNTGTTVNNFTATAILGANPTDKTCTSTSGSVYTCKITGLTDGLPYTFTVVANGPNSAVSAASSPSSTVTPGVAPAAPTNVVASTTGAGVPTVSWTPSTTEGVTYTVAAYKNDVADPTTTCTVAAGSNAVQCGGTVLVAGAVYKFKVTAAKSGLSSTAAESNEINILGSTNAPTNVVAAGGDTEATLTWSAPASGTIAKYRAVATGGGVTKACVTTGLTCTITGLTNGVTYTTTVASINSSGTASAATASAPTTVIPAVVPKPDPPTVTPPAQDDITSTSATISWTPAAPINGAAVVYYTVTATPAAAAGAGAGSSNNSGSNNSGGSANANAGAASAGTLSCTAVAPATTCAITGMTPGTQYTVTVVAYASPTVYSTAASTTITTAAAAPGTAGAMRGPIITNSDGLAQIFARGGDNNLYTSIQAANGTWGPWTNLSGLIFSDPTAVLNANGRITVFAIGGNHAIWYRLQNADGTFAWWAPLGTPMYASNIEVAQNADGTVAVFMRGTDSNLYSQVQTDPADPSQWSGWTNLGGLIFSEPTAFTRADGVMEVFAVGGDGQVWHRVQSAPNSGTWSWWTHVS